MRFKKKEELSENVADDEPLARFIFSNSHFSKETRRVKRQAFMPRNGKVSVIRHKNCPEDCLLKIGKIMEKKRDNSLKAVSSVLTKDVRLINGLDVESDISGEQHRRHANIKNFGNYNEAKIKQIARKLAQKANLINVL